MADEAVSNAIGQVLANLQRQIAELEAAVNETKVSLAGGGDMISKMPALIRLQSASAAVSVSIAGTLQLSGGGPAAGAVPAAAAAPAPEIPMEFFDAPAAPPAAAAAPSPPAPAGPVDVSSLPADAQKMHKKAARFSRVAVQEFLLYKKEEAEAGRKNRDLYKRFREEIDKTREQYDEKFKGIAEHKIDYFYDELVKTLANHDAAALEGYRRSN